jgi:hypothetical protein
LEDEKQAFVRVSLSLSLVRHLLSIPIEVNMIFLGKKVQKILQQPGKISDMPGAYCEAHDIRKLRPRQWINDEIVTFYSVMINNRSSQFETHPENFPPNEKFVKAYCFSSFFMAKYDKAGYDGVKRWSKKVPFPLSPTQYSPFFLEADLFVECGIL